MKGRKGTSAQINNVLNYLDFSLAWNPIKWGLGFVVYFIGGVFCLNGPFLSFFFLSLASLV